MGKLISFATERVGSLVSKKLGAALGAESIAATSAPDLQGIPLIVYIVVQGLLDGWKYWADRG